MSTAGGRILGVLHEAATHDSSVRYRHRIVERVETVARRPGLSIRLAWEVTHEHISGHDCWESSVE